MKRLHYKGAEVIHTCSINSYFHQFVGAQTAIEAVWAYLVSVPVRRSGYAEDIEGAKIKMIQHTTYLKFTKRLDSGFHELVLVHPAIAKDWSGSIALIITDTDERIPEAFLPRLQEISTFPVLNEWEQKMWSLGSQTIEVYPHKNSRYPVNVQPIEKLGSAAGIHGWLVRNGKNEELAWLNIIRQILGIEEKEVQH